VAQCAVVAHHVRFELALAVVANRLRCGPAHLYADADSEHALRLVLEFERLQIGMDGVRDLADCDGACVLDLLLREKRVVVAAMPAVGANAARGSLDARARGDLEIAETLRNRAFAAEVPVGIG